MRRTLAHGWRFGFATGLGVAAADGLYGSFAAFGLTFITQTLVELRAPIGLVGGLFLFYLGWRTLRSAGHAARSGWDGGAARISFGGAFASALALGVTNPMTILLFAAVFAGSGLAVAGGDSGSAAALVAGVVAGSTLWWLILSGGTALLRARLTPGALVWADRLSAVILMVFGIMALANAVG
jgi:putative LysE/RhtB family amino acid efflux pump